ncbi:hypothetical protein ABC270_14305 [Curtobacterium sp. 1P10AnD]|uniref:hypothetical protein n=1 Tax=Curtobacterium sp. 1P10AnD TaxID=3132283 RepID=UPI0039A27ED5
MTDTRNPPTAPQHRTPRTHLLAQARVRSLTARPVGPFRVTSAHAFRAGDR